MLERLKEKGQDLVEKFDGWVNQLSGMGVSSRDKNEASFWRRRPRRRYEELDSMYRQDPLAARIIDVVVDDALRQGFHLEFKGENPEEEVDSETVHEFNSRFYEWCKRVHLHTQVKHHLKSARVYGGSILVLGADDGQDPREPLNEVRVGSFDYVKAMDRFQLSASGLLDTDPTSSRFGFPVYYYLQSVFSSTNEVTGLELERLQQGIEVSPRTQQEDLTANQTLNNVTVHASRVVRTDGTLLSDRSRLNNDGWGDSFLERAWEPLRHWNTALKATASLVHDFSQGVYKLKGLRDVLAAGKQGLLRQRFEVQDLSRSVWNAVILDADGEDYQRQTTSLAGLPEVIDRFGQHLSGAAGMPLTLILGVSPGGFGTGEAEGDNWDDVVKAYQEEHVRPVLERVVEVLFLTPEFAGAPSNWHVEFKPLKQTSELEKAEIHNKQADADLKYVTMGALSPSEVANSRFGGKHFSLETTLDEVSTEGDEREQDDQEAAELNQQALEGETETTEGEPTSVDAAKPQEAFNGAQVASLVDVAVKVKAGELPLETAVQLVAVAFPVDEAKARALLTPAAELGEEEEENAPEPPSVPPPGLAPQPPALPVVETPDNSEENEEESGEEEA